MENKDKNRIQYNIGDRPQKHGHHTHGPKALGIDKAVHAQACHDKDIAHEIDRHISVCVGYGGVAGAKEIQHGPLEHQAQDRQQDSHCHHHHKGIAHDGLRLFLISPSPFNGAQGSAAHAEKVGKGNHNGYDGQAETQPGEGKGGILWYHSYINAVHNIIQHIDELR